MYIHRQNYTYCAIDVSEQKTASGSPLKAVVKNNYITFNDNWKMKRNIPTKAENKKEPYPSETR